MRFFTAAIITIFLVLCGPASSRANNIRELLPLDFGAFVITDSGAHSIVVAPNGVTTTPDGGIHKIRGGRAARFQIINADPTVFFYLTIDPTTIVHTNGSPSFNIDTFTYDPPNDSGNMIHTDPDNNLTVNIGATLHIAPGTPSTSGVYRGTYNFMINF